jgi:hypothetical protein
MSLALADSLANANPASAFSFACTTSTTDAITVDSAVGHARTASVTNPIGIGFSLLVHFLRQIQEGLLTVKSD